MEYDPTIADKISQEEKDWRKALQIGSELDAVKFDVEYNLKVWAKAHVTRLDGELVEVTFENDSRRMCRLFWWYSPDI